MRPLKLELEGFTSFREATCVDFTDADLFVLSGPMGAGKSSIIDAIGFALYGSVARFQNRSLVAPVISQGLNEARVRLDFRLGNREYTAVRVVRRTRTGGAGQPEARLYAGETLLAEDADGVSRKAEELLGLNFEQFTKCVVLPQGEFADLLHARPAERQELLVRLLDIGLYRKIGERAAARVNRGEGMLSQLNTRLENELRDVSQAAYDAQEKRVETLAALLETLDQQEQTLQDLARTASERATAAEQAGTLLATLEQVRIPAGLDELVNRMVSARQAEEAAAKREAEVVGRIEALEKQRSDLPDVAALELTIRTYGDQASTRSQIAARQQAFDEQTVALEQAATEAQEARSALDAAIDERDRLMRADSAYHASRGLKAGDTCPICGEVLTVAPSLPLPTGVSAAEEAVASARRALQQREKTHSELREDVAGLQSSLSQLRERLATLDEQLQGRPSLQETQELLQNVRKLEDELQSLRRLERNVRLARGKAQQELEAAQRDEQQAWSRFHTARASVAAAGAPEAEGTLGECWQALTQWTQAAAAEQRQLQAQLRQQADEARGREAALRQEQEALAVAAGVTTGGRPVRDAVLQERARAERDLQRLDERLTERISVERDHEAVTKSTATARLLRTHLRADRFEKWYLQEAMSRLVSGATARMQELTNQQYSLAVNQSGNDFVVIDHVNANEQRPVRTLSGGETFLASLSLALALGDDIASLAAKGAARLDALFLDEGFGSLDQNTLETVATAIEELGARGRMVGIVTHVQELADRIPTQFRVSKVNGSSRVERSEQR